jgi:hypothetical protein
MRRTCVVHASYMRKLPIIDLVLLLIESTFRHIPFQHRTNFKCQHKVEYHIIVINNNNNNNTVAETNTRSIYYLGMIGMKTFATNSPSNKVYIL